MRAPAPGLGDLETGGWLHGGPLHCWSLDLEAYWRQEAWRLSLALGRLGLKLEAMEAGPMGRTHGRAVQPATQQQQQPVDWWLLLG